MILRITVDTGQKERAKPNVKFTAQACKANHIGFLLLCNARVGTGSQRVKIEFMLTTVWKKSINIIKCIATKLQRICEGKRGECKKVGWEVQT